MDKQFNLVTVLEATQKRWKPIAVISILVLIGTFIVTHPALKILPPKYESHSVIFPANLALSDRPYLFEASSAIDVQLDLFGDKHDVDRLVSIALSGQVLAELVEKFNLIEHYKINPQKVKYPLTAAISKLKSNFKAYKNQFRGVEVWVTDKDKEIAAALANEAVAITDRINRSMLMDGRKRMLVVLQKHAENKQQELETLAAQMTSASENQKRTLEMKQSLALEQLTKYTNMLDQFQLIANEDISTIHVMERAYPAEKESSGRLVLMVGALLFTVFVLVLGATVIHVMSK